MSTTISDLLESARSGFARLGPAETRRALESGALVVDTRCGDARREDGAIPGSVHVPLSVLFWRLDPASPFRDPRLARPDRQVILVCAHGYSSSLAAATLRTLGFERATDLAGGFEAWAAAGMPVERPEARPFANGSAADC